MGLHLAGGDGKAGHGGDELLLHGGDSLEEERRGHPPQVLAAESGHPQESQATHDTPHPTGSEARPPAH